MTKQELARTLRDYPTKRDLKGALKEQDKRFAKRIAESEAWGERVFATNERVDKLEREMVRRFNESDGKIDALEHRLTDKIEGAIEASEHRIVGAMHTIVAQLTPKQEHRRLEKRVSVLERKAG